MTILSTLAPEEGTYIIEVGFTDEEGDSVVPDNGLTWTLTDVDGNVINSRSNVAIASAATINIVLSGNDLAISNNGRKRVVTIQGAYDSDLGSNLPLKAEVRFTIADLLMVT